MVRALHRPFAVVLRQLDQRSHAVVALHRDFHHLRCRLKLSNFVNNYIKHLPAYKA